MPALARTSPADDSSARREFVERGAATREAAELAPTSLCVTRRTKTQRSDETSAEREQTLAARALAMQRRRRLSRVLTARETFLKAAKTRPRGKMYSAMTLQARSAQDLGSLVRLARSDFARSRPSNHRSALAECRAHSSQCQATSAWRAASRPSLSSRSSRRSRRTCPAMSTRSAASGDAAYRPDGPSASVHSARGASGLPTE